MSLSSTWLKMARGAPQYGCRKPYMAPGWAQGKRERLYLKLWFMVESSRGRSKANPKPSFSRFRNCSVIAAKLRSRANPKPSFSRFRNCYVIARIFKATQMLNRIASDWELFRNCFKLRNSGNPKPNFSRFRNCSVIVRSFKVEQILNRVFLGLGIVPYIRNSCGSLL